MAPNGFENAVLQMLKDQGDWLEKLDGKVDDITDRLIKVEMRIRWRAALIGGIAGFLPAFGLLLVYIILG